MGLTHYRLCSTYTFIHHHFHVVLSNCQDLRWGTGTESDRRTLKLLSRVD